MHPYFEIFGRSYPAYGTCIAAGAVLAILTSVLVTRRKYNFEFVDYTFGLAWVAVIAIAGSKLLYLIVELREFIANPRLFIDFLRGGAVFYGGLIGAVLGAYISSRIRKWNFIELLDTLAAPGALAHACGRIGCFMAGCCYGMETDSIFGVQFPEGSLAPAGVKVLPIQLFEAFFLFILAGVLFWIFWRAHRPGLSVGIYMIAYAIWRFVLEYFRDDRRGSVGVFTTSQFVSIFIFIGGIVIVAFSRQLVVLFDKVKIRKTIKERHMEQSANSR